MEIKEQFYVIKNLTSGRFVFNSSCQSYSTPSYTKKYCLMLSVLKRLSKLNKQLIGLNLFIKKKVTLEKSLIQIC